jgi:hypothetical protein
VLFDVPHLCAKTIFFCLSVRELMDEVKCGDSLKEVRDGFSGLSVCCCVLSSSVTSWLRRV